MRKQWIIVGVIVALLAAGAALGVRLAPDIFPVEVGARAPEFHAVRLSTGESVSLSDYRGKVVLLNIWATWCVPCRAEMPSLEALHREFPTDSFAIVTVSIDEGGPDVVRAFAEELGLTFEILHDRTRQIERIYQTTGVPETFVLNRDGRIVSKKIGAHDWNSPTNRDLIRRLIAQRG